MTLGNMRELGVQRLIASCLNDACRHTLCAKVRHFSFGRVAPNFYQRRVCAKCGSRGKHIDARPNWKEQPPQQSLTGKQWR
jgi:hypothetical protein